MLGGCSPFLPWVICLGLLSVLGPAGAVRFTDPFLSLPDAPDRKPFVWDGFSAGDPAAPTWTVSHGVLQFAVRDGRGSMASCSFQSLGLTVTDNTDWSLEVGFRHLEGEPPRAAYEALAYITWAAADPGQMRVVGLLYEAPQAALVVLNGGGFQATVPADLTGAFHQVRLTVGREGLRLYVDGQAAGGPWPLRAIAYSQPAMIAIGPITGGEDITVTYQFDYLAFSNEGAVAPPQPMADREPVAQGVKIVHSAVDQPPYPGITVLSREQGDAAWEAAMPEHWRRLRDIIAREPTQLEAALFQYPDAPDPSRQNMYRNYQALRYDDARCVAIAHSTRGIDDTAEGFADYKLWYRVSTDGGMTYDAERPLVQSGPDFSPMHPNQYVWVGKNSFCYAAIPPLIRMSNGQVLLPIYFAPLDEQGRMYNPLGAFTFTWVAALIGTWNESGTDLIWDISPQIRLTAEQSSRGANECAVAELTTPGHILMITRGSNEPDPTGKLPAIKWKTLSPNYGRTWSPYTPFTYTDGEQFLSPSSCSSLIRSSRTGKLYWIGNISRQQPRGNWPRYPLIIAEVDEETLGLRRETVTIIDDRRREDSTDLQLSNFGLVEDARTGHIVVTLERWQPQGGPGTGTYTYVIAVQ